jgi:outer membrane protein TolC
MVSGGEAQRIQLGRDLSGQWWTLFGSLQLDALIGEAMENNPDIAAQQAALRATSENAKAENRAFFPNVAGAGNYSRAKASGASIAPGFPGFISNIYRWLIGVGAMTVGAAAGFTFLPAAPKTVPVHLVTARAIAGIDRPAARDRRWKLQATSWLCGRRQCRASASTRSTRCWSRRASRSGKVK